MSLAIALKEIEKKFGKGKVLPASEAPGIKLRRLTTGSLALDIETGGGWILGKFNEVFGRQSSGKTFIALHTIAANQKIHPTANFAWIDAEGAFDREWAVKCGVDLDRLLITSPEYMEEALDIVSVLVRSRDMFLIVIDSWAALSPKNEFENDMDSNTMGLRARTGNKFVRKTKPFSDMSAEDIDLGKTTILVINQLYAGIGPYAGEETPGGVQLGHACLLRVKLRRGDFVTDSDGTMLTQETVFVVEKNKTAPAKTKGSFVFVTKDCSEGKSGEIIKLDEILLYATKVGYLVKAGAWYTLPDKYGVEKPFQGAPKVKEWFKEQPEEVQEEFSNDVLKLATARFQPEEEDADV